MDKKTKFLSVLVVALLVLCGYLIWERNYKVSDPFQNVNAQTYGTQGKVLEISANGLKMEAAVSKSTGQGNFSISMENRTVKTTEATKYYKYNSSREKVEAFRDEVKAGTQVTVTTKQNPNTSAEFTAEEVLIVPTN